MSIHLTSHYSNNKETITLPILEIWEQSYLFLSEITFQGSRTYEGQSCLMLELVL